MQDKYRKRYRLAAGFELGCASRSPARPPGAFTRRWFLRVRNLRPGWLDAANTSDLYAAKRKAAAVLGHRLRPGDLPSDSEVREQLLAHRQRASRNIDAESQSPSRSQASHRPLSPKPSTDLPSTRCGSSRSNPSSKTPSSTPRETPFFTACRSFNWPRDSPLRRGIPARSPLARRRPGHRSPDRSVAAGIEALRGSVTERTLWLIEHQMELTCAKTAAPARKGAPALNRHRHATARSTNPSTPTICCCCASSTSRPRSRSSRSTRSTKCSEYLKGLEHESYLDD